MEKKIAILTDSGSDVPAELAKELDIFVVPLQINYEDRSYLDGVEIDAKTVYDNLPTEIPTTSLPKGEDIFKTIETIKSKGYTQILAIVLSSGLSGTYNLFKLLSAQSSIPMEVLDTKNIGIGSGLSVIKAAVLAKKGLDWDTLLINVQETIKNTKVFFVLNTLEYLRKGGRIGKVTAFLGQALNLKPIITCNHEGVYTTIATARGRKQSIKRCLELALESVKEAKAVTIALAHGDAFEEMNNLKKEIESRLSNIAHLYLGQISPALGVHTGPGLIGIGVQATQPLQQ